MADDGQMSRKLAESLREASVDDRDQAGVQLARRLAQLLDQARGGEDEARVFNDLAPKYQAVLTALGLTPAGRKGGGSSGGSTGSGKLDELRSRRAGGD